MVKDFFGSIEKELSNIGIFWTTRQSKHIHYNVKSQNAYLQMSLISRQVLEDVFIFV